MGGRSRGCAGGAASRSGATSCWGNRRWRSARQSGRRRRRQRGWQRRSGHGSAAASGCKAQRQVTTQWGQWLACSAKRAYRCQQARPTLALPQLESQLLRWRQAGRRRCPSPWYRSPTRSLTSAVRSLPSRPLVAKQRAALVNPNRTLRCHAATTALAMIARPRRKSAQSATPLR